MPRVNGAVEAVESPEAVSNIIANELNKVEFVPVKPDSKFTLNIQADGKMSLTIRTDSEDELNELITRWEPRVVEYSEPLTEKPRYYGGDTCPKCLANKLVRRKGAHGRFLGCTGYPDCSFTAPA